MITSPAWGSKGPALWIESPLVVTLADGDPVQPSYLQLITLGTTLLFLVLADLAATILAMVKAERAVRRATELKQDLHGDLKEKLENGIAEKLRIILVRLINLEEQSREKGGEKEE